MRQSMFIRGCAALLLAVLTGAAAPAQAQQLPLTGNAWGQVLHSSQAYLTAPPTYVGFKRDYAFATEALGDLNGDTLTLTFQRARSFGKRSAFTPHVGIVTLRQTDRPGLYIGEGRISVAVDHSRPTGPGPTLLIAYMKTQDLRFVAQVTGTGINQRITGRAFSIIGPGETGADVRDPYRVGLRYQLGVVLTGAGQRIDWPRSLNNFIPQP